MHRFGRLIFVYCHWHADGQFLLFHHPGKKKHFPFLHFNNTSVEPDGYLL